MIKNIKGALDLKMEVTCRFDESKYVLKTYNNCYGGGVPKLTKKAKEYFDSMTGSDAERLLRTVEKFDEKSTKKTRGHRFTSFGFYLCPIECSDFCDVDEYDGLESPYINRDRYLKVLIKEYFENNETMNKSEYDGLVAKSQNVNLDFIELNYE
jgi:hypothetical protein